MEIASMRALNLLTASLFAALLVGIAGPAAADAGPAPAEQQSTAIADAQLLPAYYYRGGYYPYRYHNHYYRYHYNNRYYNHRSYHGGRWRYY